MKIKLKFRWHKAEDAIEWCRVRTVMFSYPFDEDLFYEHRDGDRAIVERALGVTGINMFGFDGRVMDVEMFVRKPLPDCNKRAALVALAALHRLQDARRFIAKHNCSVTHACRVHDHQWCEKCTDSWCANYKRR